MGRDLLATEAHTLTLGQKAKAKDTDTWPSHGGSHRAVLCPFGTVLPGGLRHGGPARRATPTPMPPVQAATRDQRAASTLLTTAVGPLEAGGRGPALLAGPQSRHSETVPPVPSLRDGALGHIPAPAALPCPAPAPGGTSVASGADMLAGGQAASSSETWELPRGPCVWPGREGGEGLRSQPAET